MPAMNPDPETRARLLGLFLLGLVLFLPPIVGLAERGTVLGIPTLFFAIYAGWALVVALLAVILSRARSGGRDRP
jgi:hypothetical protein